MRGPSRAARIDRNKHLRHCRQGWRQLRSRSPRTVSFASALTASARFFSSAIGSYKSPISRTSSARLTLSSVEGTRSDVAVNDAERAEGRRRGQRPQATRRHWNGNGCRHEKSVELCVPAEQSSYFLAKSDLLRRRVWTGPKDLRAPLVKTPMIVFGGVERPTCRNSTGQMVQRMRVSSA
jgi:hypothetical protein